MANGGNSGGDLDRLRDEIEATRADVAGLAGAVGGLTDLLTDLVRRTGGSGTDHQSERWQARLGGLETRLEMMETAIRSEVERIRAAAGAVDELADDFKVTVGDTKNLVELASDLSERLTTLQSLERQVRGAAQDIASAVDERLARDVSDRENREAALFDRVGSSFEELRIRVDAIAEVTSGSSTDVTRLRGDLDGSIEATRKAIADAMDGLRIELNGIETRIQQASAADDRLSQLAAAVEQVRAHQPQLTMRLDELARDVAEARSSAVDPRETLAGIGDRLDALASAMRNAVASQLDPRPQLDQIAASIESLRSAATNDTEPLDRLTTELAELRAAQVDPRPLFEHLATEVGALRAGQHDPAEPLSRVEAELAELRSSLRESTDRLAALDRFDAQLRALHDGQLDPAEVVERVRAVLPDPSTSIDRVAALLDQQAATLAELRSTQPDAQAGFDRISSDLDLVAQELERFSRELAEQGNASPPEIAVDLEPLSRRLDELAQQLPQLHTTVDLEPLSRRLDELAQQLPQLHTTVDLEPLSRRLDELAQQLPQLHTTVDLEPLSRRFDDLAEQLIQLKNQPSTEAILGRVASVLNDQSSALSQLQAGQPQLTVRLDQLAADLAELAQGQTITRPVFERLDRIATDVAELRANEDWLVNALTPLSQRIDAFAEEVRVRLEAPVDVRPSLDRLSEAIAELRDVAAGRTEEWADNHDRQLAGVADAVQQLSQHIRLQPDMGSRLDELQAELADMRTRTPDVGDLLGPLGESLDALRAELRPLHDSQAALAEVSGAIAELRAAQLDPEELQRGLADRLDRVTAEVVAFRAAQPDPDEAARALHGRFDQLAVQLTSLGTQLDQAAMPGIDVAGALEPLGAQLANIDARGAATSDAVVQLEAALAQTTAQLANVVAGVAELRERPDDRAELLSPIADRVAGVLDGVSAIQADLTAVADGFAAVKGDRTLLAQVASDTATRLDALAANIGELHQSRSDVSASVTAANARLGDIAEALVDVRSLAPDMSARIMETNGRLDQIAATVAELRESRPDLTSSFVAISSALDSLQATVTDTHNRVNALDELAREPRAEDTAVSAAVAPLVDQLESLSEQAANTEQRVSSILENLADSFGRVETERVSTITGQLDEVRQAVNGLSDRQSSAMMDVLQQFEQVTNSAAITQEISRSIEGVLKLQSTTGTDERLGDLSQQVATLAADVKATVRALVGLGADVTSLRTDVESLVTANDNDDSDEMRTTLSRLDAAIAERDEQLRDTVQRLDTAIAERDEQLRDTVQRLDTVLSSRDENVRDVLRRLDEAIGQAGEDVDFSQLERHIDTAISELGRELSGIRALANRDPAEPLRTVQEHLEWMRNDLNTISREVTDLRNESARPTDDAPALRLEGHIESEFEAVGQQMEALGTLLGQLIDAMHRVETQVVGAHPVSDKMRSAAASVLENLRTNVRQRSRRNSS